MPTRRGSFKLFSFLGINVFVHWSWFVIAVLFVEYGADEYSSVAWNALQYASLFLIVLLHEFGHQLACRQVGGQTNDIILWPLGGVAYVSPPPRPAADLWSIAAGPLVNVILIPILATFVSVGWHMGLEDTHHDLYELLQNVYLMNFVLLGFNLMPVYPLDGGQILRALLWFRFGRSRSLFIATMIGFLGAAALLALAVWAYFRGVAPIFGGLIIAIAVFMAMRNWSAVREARALTRATRHAAFACPSCKATPPTGNFWMCGRCGAAFDIFQTMGACPNCQLQFTATQCLNCGASGRLEDWNSQHHGVEA